MNNKIARWVLTTIIMTLVVAIVVLTNDLQEQLYMLKKEVIMKEQVIKEKTKENESFSCLC